MIVISIISIITNILVRGFHLKFTGSKLEANIQTWDVQVLEVGNI